MQGRASIPVQGARCLVVERHPESVVAISREGVHHRNAAACTVRRAVDVLALRRPAGHRIGRFARRRAGIAHSQPADLGSRREIPLHQGRREELRVGDVVEVGALGVERQEIAGVYVQREQIVNRTRVLGAV